MMPIILLFVSFMIITWVFNILVLTFVVLFFTVDDTYKIFNRKAFELISKVICLLKIRPKYIFMDMDKLHDMNDIYGHSTVDNMIKQSFSKFRRISLRRLPDYIFRYYSGDEFVIVVFDGNPMVAAQRCLGSLTDPLSATICCADRLKDAIAGVEYMKRQNMRGMICSYNDLAQGISVETYELVKY
jgi:diguanylate cyclase (GGDEF)-like protein